MKKTKLLSLLLSVAMLVTLFAGCTSTGDTTTSPIPSAAPTTAPTGDTATPTNQPTSGEGFNLSVCFASEPMTIDPALNSSVDGAVMIQHMFEGLTKWDDSGKEFDSSANFAEMVPGQAESWDKVDNGDGTVTYTFHLRDDIKWSDGKPVTAGDFEYAWRRLVTPETAADYVNMLSMVKGYDEVVNQGADPSTLAVSATDEKTFVVTLTYDCPYFLEICAFPSNLPVRQDMIEQNGDQWTFKPETYIGNGAYKMSDWTHNASITMVKNDQYYDYAKLGPDTITFRLMDDDNAILASYRSGELDYLQNLPVDEVPSLLASGDLHIADYIGTYYVCYQTQNAPFDDWRVRKAFTLAINSKYIVENVTQTGQVPAGGFVAAGVSDADPAGNDFRTVGGDYWNPPLTEEQYQANCEEARQLLAEAGFPNGEGFPVVTYLYNTNDEHKAIAEALQQQWQQVLNVTVKIENQDWSVFLENRKQGNYQIARNGWISDYNDPMAFLDMWLTGGGNNDAQYSNPDYDAAIQEAMSTADPAARMAAMHKAEDLIIGQDWALGPIYFYTQKFMLKDDVEGMFYTPLGFFFFMYTSRG